MFKNKLCKSLGGERGGERMREEGGGSREEGVGSRQEEGGRRDGG